MTMGRDGSPSPAADQRLETSANRRIIDTNGTRSAPLRDFSGEPLAWASGSGREYSFLDRV
jgi:hypothetical protein